MNVLDRITEIIKQAPIDKQLILIIKPDTENEGKVFLHYDYRDIIDDVELATSKQIKYIKDLSNKKKNKNKINLDSIETITKAEARDLIKFLLDEDDYDENVIYPYLRENYKNLY